LHKYRRRPPLPKKGPINRKPLQSFDQKTDARPTSSQRRHMGTPRQLQPEQNRQLNPHSESVQRKAEQHKRIAVPLLFRRVCEERENEGVPRPRLRFPSFPNFWRRPSRIGSFGSWCRDESRFDLHLVLPTPGLPT
jgi:hypothetical protein